MPTGGFDKIFLHFGNTDLANRVILNELLHDPPDWGKTAEDQHPKTAIIGLPCTRLFMVGLKAHLSAGNYSAAVFFFFFVFFFGAWERIHS